MKASEPQDATARTPLRGRTSGQRSVWLIALVVGAILVFAVARQRGWIGAGASANAQASKESPRVGGKDGTNETPAPEQATRSDPPNTRANASKTAKPKPFLDAPIDVTQPVMPASGADVRPKTVQPARQTGTTTRAPAKGEAAKSSKPGSGTKPTTTLPKATDGGIAGLYRDKKSDTWVEATARVVKLLPDDSDGDRHQKWLAEIPGTQLTVRFVHNIDIAPRVPLTQGEAFQFRGEYEWTEQGGTVHFTHRPKYQRKSGGGWIDAGGVRYE